MRCDRARHPLGASGTRLLITVLYELRRRKAKYGLTTACIGGGQGIAVIVENCSGKRALTACSLISRMPAGQVCVRARVYSCRSKA